MFLFLPQFFHLLYRLPAWNSVTYHIACVIACWFIFSTIHALDKEMATHSSVLAWRIPGTGEPGGLPSMGSHRVGLDWSNLAAAAAVSLVYAHPLFFIHHQSVAPGLLPCLRCGKEGICAHRGAHIFSNQCFSFLSITIQKWSCWTYGSSIFNLAQW